MWVIAMTDEENEEEDGEENPPTFHDEFDDGYWKMGYLLLSIAYVEL